MYEFMLFFSGLVLGVSAGILFVIAYLIFHGQRWQVK